MKLLYPEPVEGPIVDIYASVGYNFFQRFVLCKEQNLCRRTVVGTRTASTHSWWSIWRWFSALRSRRGVVARLEKDGWLVVVYSAQMRKKSVGLSIQTNREGIERLEPLEGTMIAWKPEWLEDGTSYLEAEASVSKLTDDLRKRYGPEVTAVIPTFEEVQTLVGALGNETFQRGWAWCRNRYKYDPQPDRKLRVAVAVAGRLIAVTDWDESRTCYLPRVLEINVAQKS